MRTWLPWMLLAFSALLIAAMPWRRPDPRHQFIFRLISSMEEGDPAEPKADSIAEVHQLGRGTAAGRPHRSGSSGV